MIGGDRVVFDEPTRLAKIRGIVAYCARVCGEEQDYTGGSAYMSASVEKVAFCDRGGERAAATDFKLIYTSRPTIPTVYWPPPDNRQLCDQVKADG